MTRIFKARALPLAIATLLAASPVMAQNVTSAGVSGRVVDAQGKPVAGATVQIVHEPSGTTKVVTTNADGRYAAQGLRVGGPFDITVSKSGMTKSEKDNVYLQLGQVSSVNLAMGAEMAKAQKLGTVTVTSSALTDTFNPDNKGLSTNVSHTELEANPVANRSIDDVARLDPRINVVNQGDGSISAMGLPNRYNSIQVDGVGVGDPFGLNANGLPYQNTPISQDTIEEYNLSTSNFDVTSDTVGADINAVTKSGTNQFHGSVYYVYQNAKDMVGKAGWLDSSNPGYDYNGFDKNTTTGFTLGGPILKDKLFFFVSAEKQKVTGIGAGASTGLDPSLGSGPSSAYSVSPGDLQQVINIAKNLGLQPGTYGGASGVTLDDKRYLAKIDWNITDNHRMSLAVNKTQETLPVTAGNSSSSVGLTSYTYTQAIKTDNISLQFFDDWSDNFSTQTKFGYQHFTQNTNVPAQQPDIQVYTGAHSSVYLGENQYRHYNKIDTKKATFFFAGTYYAGDHTIKGGIYAERNKIYNLFGKTEFGAYRFYSIADFANAQYGSYNLYQPAPGYTINDVAAQWTYSQYSPFIQDTWQVNDNLSVQYGVRVDIPKANKKPIYNPAFQQTFGYPNNNTLGFKNKVIEPRFSFNYTFDTDRMTQLRGGVGLFQTFPPTVWLTNPYQNNGMTQVSYSSYDPSTTPFSPDPFNQPIPPGGPNGGRMDVDTISSNFKLPTVWKMSLALDRELPWWHMIGSIEYQHTQAKNAIFYKAINIGTPTGTLPDGRYQYWSDPTTGTGGTNTGADPNFTRGYHASTLLTNTNKGKTDSVTLALKKPFSGDWAASAAFTLTHATEVNPGGSSQASSGYKYWARVNPNQNVASTADRNIAQSVKLGVTWRHAFFGNYNTMVSAFYTGHTGLPYTWIFSSHYYGDVNGDGIGYEDPAYIPKVNDPIVSYGSASAQQIQAFQDYINNDPYLSTHRGQIAGLNQARYPWVNRMDVSFQQEVPGLFKDNKGIIRLDIYNFLNMLNKSWGQTRNLSYDTRSLVGYSGINAQGQYVYDLSSTPQNLQVYDAGSNPTRVVSRWSAMLTLKYTF